MRNRGEPTTLEDVNTIQILLNTHTITRDVIPLIKNISNAYIGGNVCTKCPSSIMQALNKIKLRFTQEWINNIKNQNGW